VLDNILVSNNLSDTVEVDIVHVNVDYASDDPARGSDHEPIVARILLPEVEVPATPLPTATPGVSVTITMTLLAESQFDVGTAVIPPEVISGTDSISGAASFVFREISVPSRGLSELLNPSLTVSRTLVGAYELRLLDAAGNDITGELTAPLSVTLNYRGLPAGEDAETLGLFRYDTATGTWDSSTNPRISLDPATGQVVFAVRRLSEFALTTETRGVIAGGSTLYLPLMVR
jgi:hypothetical protein